MSEKKRGRPGNPLWKETEWVKGDEEHTREMDALPLDVLGHLQRAKTALNNPEYVHDTKKLAAALTGELGLAWHKMTRSILKPFTEGDPFEALAPFQHQSNRPLHLVSQTLQNLMVPKVSK